MFGILAEREWVWVHPLLPGPGALEGLEVEVPETQRHLYPGPVPGPARLLGIQAVNWEHARKYLLATGDDVSVHPNP